MFSGWRRARKNPEEPSIRARPRDSDPLSAAKRDPVLQERIRLPLQISDSYPRREDLIRGDYNLSNRFKIFAHFVNNFDAVTSYYGSFVLGSTIPLVPVTDARPGKGLVIGTT